MCTFQAPSTELESAAIYVTWRSVHSDTHFFSGPSPDGKGDRAYLYRLATRFILLPPAHQLGSRLGICDASETSRVFAPSVAPHDERMPGGNSFLQIKVRPRIFDVPFILCFFTAFFHDGHAFMAGKRDMLAAGEESTTSP